MLLGNRSGRIRCLVVWTSASIALGGVGVAVRTPVGRLLAQPEALHRQPLDVALTEIAALALLGCAVWMWAATTAVVVEVLRRRVATSPWQHVVPAGVRRVVLAACGVALAGGLAQPSYAGGPQAHHPHVHHRPSVLSGLPLPDRAVVPPPAARRTARVRPGDTLWSLAARDLPPGSPDALVAARWHAIYAANRALIGPDPDVITPGQRLRLPGKDPT